MRSRPCVLVVSPVASHPADQGNSARIQTLAFELKYRGADVELLYYGMEGLTEGQRSDMEVFWKAFHFMPSLPLPKPSFARHWGIDDWCPQELCRAVSDLHQKRQYDAVLVNYVWMSRVFLGLQGTLKILDTHDLFGDRHEASIVQGLEPRWYFTSLAQEEIGFSRADLIIGIQSAETECIRSRTSVRCITVGHHIPPHFLTDFEESRAIAMFGYIGSGNPWNIKSLIALDEAIGGSKIKISWLLAGTLPASSLRLKSSPFLLGRVDRLGSFYQIVDCIVNPMMGGTGLKIKSVEAIAFGKPIIGTLDAFQGLPTQHPMHCLHSAAECMVAMERYHEDENVREDVRQASRKCYFQYARAVGEEIGVLYSYIGG